VLTAQPGRLALYPDNLYINVQQLLSIAISVFLSWVPVVISRLHSLEDLYMRLSMKWIPIFVLAALAALSAAAATPEKNSIPPITQSSFGFQCGTGKLTNCPNETWPTTIAQPGMIRLWDSQVQWHLLNPSAGVYNWKILDGYLDAIAAHQPRSAMYTFGYTPCWATKGKCERDWGSPFPPDDLTPSGSPSFDTFVIALLGHCSAGGHCVKDTIKYWELWNEANAPNYWSGTVPQLYQLMAPAVALVRSKVAGAFILTPPASRGDTDWMRDWLNQENKNGRLSDIFSFHLYLQNNLPEPRFGTVKQMIDLKNSTSGWSDTPWMNSETNFDARTFACNSRYTQDDCIGQMVRWHLIHYSFGAQHLSWFFFNTTIGRNPDYSTAYHTMMDWLVGGHFTAACSPSGNVITCPFIQANGHRAIFAWTFDGDSQYTPNPQYVDYRTLTGGTTTLSPGKSVNVGVKPIMLEAAN